MISAGHCADTLIANIVCLSLFCLTTATGIRCLQCDAVPQEEVGACRAGRLRAQPCPKIEHTHCITHLSKMVSTGEVKVMWRRCGTQVDIQNCTKWRIPMQSDRGIGALFDQRSDRDYVAKTRRRRYYNDRVEVGRKQVERYEEIKVCSFGCDRDACLIAADHSKSPPLIPVPLFLHLCIFLLLLHR